MLNRALALYASLALVAGCSENDDANFQSPDLPTGPGRLYQVEDVSFTTVDDVVVNARFGHSSDPSARPSPVVILLHDISLNGLEWELAELGLPETERLLERGYLPLIIDSRGHGGTPLPNDGRPQPPALSVIDIENLHLEVRAALNWLRTQPAADASRVAVMGSGMGGNAAYVSMGVFGEELKAGIALSPGIFNLNTGEALGIGANLSPFEPQSMLFIAGQGDLLLTSQTETRPASAIAAGLHELTSEPKQLESRPSDLHGSLLLQDPAVFEAILAWLEDHV